MIYTEIAALPLNGKSIKFLLCNGIDFKVVSKIPGHTSVKNTYNTYIHLFETDITNSLSVIDKLFEFAS